MRREQFVRIITSLGGKAYLVGGCVRDALMNKNPKDHDYCVIGIHERDFINAFPQAEKVGTSFPVYLVDIDGEVSEIAFARKEWKSGMGYHGFTFKVDPSITIEDDLSRRDTTMNAMAVDLSTGELIDPFNGRIDIERKVVRAINIHFCDDPTRALRAARQAAQHGFAVDPYTISMMNKCAKELAHEPRERIVKELKAALGAKRPSVFFTSMPPLLLEVVFPELKQLIGQSKYYPEGDAFNHVMLVLDRVAQDTSSKTARFCALFCHDIEKPKLFDLRSYKKRKELDLVDKIDTRMTLPKEWKIAAKFVHTYHSMVQTADNPDIIVHILMEIERNQLTVSEFRCICSADSISRTIPLWLLHAEQLLDMFKNIRGANAPRTLRGIDVGNWIDHRRAEILVKFVSDASQRNQHGQSSLYFNANFK